MNFIWKEHTLYEVNTVLLQIFFFFFGFKRDFNCPINNSLGDVPLYLGKRFIPRLAAF